ncbi:uncharacterized protein LOC111010906 [Momordica charantia]|uniref:Uncharacterized protein LOC111010906 n=1 Tax=Momordica charantia TaxID=3673 RepID=A0A6J1CHE7_MOMCH|nr:uncharacterized protein LOC111010906 [Momordica charantia]
MITDSLAVFLRRGIAPTPPLPLAAFRNVSPIQSNPKHRNRLNRVETIIRCGRVTRPRRSGSDRSGGFPLPNTTTALKTLLCFTVGTDGWAAPAEHLTAINRKKKEALQKLMAENCVEAENIMMRVYEEYKWDNPQTRYDAALALVEFLIHRGTNESWEKAVGHLNDLEHMTMKENLPSDAKLPLYWAILLTLLDDREAKKSWSYYTSHIGTGPFRG